MNRAQVEMVLKLGDDLRAACEERDALRSRVEQLERELGECKGAFETGSKAIEQNTRLLALARFGRWCLAESREDFTDLEGGSIQDKAESLGLLAEITVTEPCGDEWHCAGYYGDFPTKCLRYTDLAQLPEIK